MFYWFLFGFHRFLVAFYWFLVGQCLVGFYRVPIGFCRFPYKRSKRTKHKVLFDYAHLIRSVVQVNLSGGSVGFYGFICGFHKFVVAFYWFLVGYIVLLQVYIGFLQVSIGFLIKGQRELCTKYCLTTPLRPLSSKAPVRPFSSKAPFL